MARTRARPARVRPCRRRPAAPAGLLALAALAAAGSPGCLCPQVPEVRKYFDRRSPSSALLGFAYAVETGAWDYAFESLDAESRRAVEGPLRLRFGITLEEEPTTEVPIRDFITEAIRWRRPSRRVQVRPREVRGVDVAYVAPDPETGEELPQAVVTVFLVREEDRWRIDLLSTLSVNWGELEAEGAT